MDGSTVGVRLMPSGATSPSISGRVLGLSESAMLSARRLRGMLSSTHPLRPSVATIGAHLSCSAFMWRARSSGVPPRGCGAEPRQRLLHGGRPCSASLVAWLSRAMIAGGVPSGASNAIQAPLLMARIAELRHGRHVGQFGKPRRVRHRERLEPAVADELQRGADGVEGHLHLAGDHVGRAPARRPCRARGRCRCRRAA